MPVQGTRKQAFYTLLDTIYEALQCYDYEGTGVTALTLEEDRLLAIVDGFEFSIDFQDREG